MIRVAANLAWLRPGSVGGSEEYTVRLLESVLDAAPPDIDLAVLGSPALFATHPGLQRASTIPLPGPLDVRAWRVAVESTALYRATRDADVVHHFGGRVPLRHHGGANVVTIHDLQPLERPENFSLAKRRYLGRALPRTARTARLVTTPSNWAASTIVDRLGADPDSVVAVSSTWDADERVDSSLADSLTGSVVLYPAISHPHKRHVLLLDAVDRVAAAGREVTVVLTGGAGRAEAAVAAAVARSAATVLRPGRVTPAVLRGLYRRADVLAFPSAYEGFGLPVLEAMRDGLPVVAARSTALPEVVGDTGLLIEGDDPEAWADAIDTVLAGGPAVEERAGRARARAQRWSPANAAGRLVDAWRSVA